jgi:hypothetical protein
VAAQLHRSLDHLRGKFGRVHAGSRPLTLDYLVYCPDHLVKRIAAAGLAAERIVDHRTQAYLADTIESVLGPGVPPDPGRAEEVEDFFRQAFELVPDIHAHVTAQERHFVRSGGGLIRLVSGLEMHPFRLRVWGTAGSGKTMIARHFFDEAVACGRRPLLVCFNRPLAERLRVMVRAGGRVSTWYGLIASFLQERGQRIEFQEMTRDRAFWERIRERVVAETIPPDWQFDTLIVDEGQDFEQEWAETLRLFGTDGHDALWLEDPDQNVRRQSPVTLPGYVGYRARVNHRSPRSIAQVIQRVVRCEFELGNDLPGLGVGVTAYGDEAQQPGLVARIIARLVQQGFAHRDIVILTMRHMVTPGGERSIFSARERVGNYRLRRFGGQYDLLGNQILSDGQVLFDSIGRFKGQQAPAVILVDVDSDGAPGDQVERLLLTGMTRATVRLEMVVKADDPLAARFPASGEV